MTCDVVVIGAGIVGCATAAFLARGGARVAVFDAGSIGAGASGRNAGLVEHPFEREQVALHEETVALLRDVLGPDAMPARPTGILVLFGDEREAAEEVAGAAGFPELAARVVAPDEVAALEPSLRGGTWGCWMETGYPVRPAEAVGRFAGLAREHGATIVTDGPAVLSWDGGTVRGVVVDGEEHRADVVLMAAGAASCALVDPTGRWRPVRPLWGVTVAIDGVPRPRVPLIDGRGERDVPSAFSVIPTPAELALGSTWLDDEPDGAAWAPRLLAEAAAFWPPATDAVAGAVRVCARPHAFDGRPLLGRVAGHHSLWLASGHGGRGVSTGAASARLVADAILGDDADIPPALRADRAGPPPPPCERGGAVDA